MDGATAHNWARYFSQYGITVIVRSIASGTGFLLEIGRQTLNSERECDIFDRGIQTGLMAG